MAPLPLLSPDAAEQVNQALAWQQGRADEVGGHWPPLYPSLLWLIRGLPLEHGAWLLNLSLAAAVVAPLHLLATRLGESRLAGRVAALIWVLLPAVHDHAAIPDARPLLWLLVAGAAAGLAQALRGSWRPELGWALACSCAALAPLARPEGRAALPLLVVAALLLRLPWKRALLGGALGLLPYGIYTLTQPQGWGDWGRFYLPWMQTWSMADFIALAGVAISASGYRDFLIRAMQAGLEEPPSDPTALLGELPGGLVYLAGGVLESVGILGVLGGLAGMAWLAWRSPSPPRSLAAALLVAAPLVVIAPLPMAWDQATAAANVLFVAPFLLAALGALLAHQVQRQVLRRRRLPLALGLATLLGVAGHLDPTRAERPAFFEDSQAALRASVWLEQHPPASGQVATSFAGHEVVRRAGLVPRNLASPWEIPVDEDMVLLSSAGDLGEDGGRSLELVESGAWRVAFYSVSEGRSWVIVLVPAEPAASPPPPASSTPAPDAEPRTEPPDDPSP